MVSVFLRIAASVSAFLYVFGCTIFAVRFLSSALSAPLDVLCGVAEVEAVFCLDIVVYREHGRVVLSGHRTCVRPVNPFANCRHSESRVLNPCAIHQNVCGRVFAFVYCGMRAKYE